MTNSGKKTQPPDDSNRLLAYIKKNKTLTIAIVTVLAIVFIFILVALSQKGPQRSETYKDVSGAAGLNAVIAYDCKEDCDQKYSFNVYIFTEDGRQVSTVQPNSDGEVKLALAEGQYVMLVGKQFGNDKVFPQESLALKNGKMLELKLRY